MESTLEQYRMNYIQFATTGDPKYRASYEAAQKTLDTFLQSQTLEDDRVQQIYNHSKTIPSTSLPPPRPSQTWKYWAIGILGLVSVGLMVL